MIYFNHVFCVRSVHFCGRRDLYVHFKHSDLLLLYSYFLVSQLLSLVLQTLIYISKELRQWKCKHILKTKFKNILKIIMFFCFLSKLTNQRCPNKYRLQGTQCVDCISPWTLNILAPIHKGEQIEKSLACRFDDIF